MAPHFPSPTALSLEIAFLKTLYIPNADYLFLMSFYSLSFFPPCLTDFPNSKKNQFFLSSKCHFQQDLCRVLFCFKATAADIVCERVSFIFTIGIFFPFFFARANKMEKNCKVQEESNLKFGNVLLYSDVFAEESMKKIIAIKKVY